MIYQLQKLIKLKNSGISDKKFNSKIILKL